jgi:hypothetical protein
MPFRESGWNMEITVIKRTQVMTKLRMTYEWEGQLYYHCDYLI